MTAVVALLLGTFLTVVLGMTAERWVGFVRERLKNRPGRL